MVVGYTNKTDFEAENGKYNVDSMLKRTQLFNFVSTHFLFF